MAIENFLVRITVHVADLINNLSASSGIKKNHIVGVSCYSYFSLPFKERDRIREQFLSKYGNEPQIQRCYRLPEEIILKIREEKRNKGIKGNEAIVGAACFHYFESIDEGEGYKLLGEYLKKYLRTQ